MKTIRVGYSRIYNVYGCCLQGSEETLMRFNLGETNVGVYVGPNLRHTIMNFTISPTEQNDENTHGKNTRQQKFDTLSPEIFPADLYTELVATQNIEVENDLAAAFQNREAAARNEILRRAEELKPKLITSLDFIAGLLGLRLGNMLVRTPITEQLYAYRDDGVSYALSTGTAFHTIATLEWNLSDKSFLSMPKLRNQWKLDKAAEVLAWLLRAWSAKDPVLEFVSLFIPLECIIPGIPNEGKEAEWYKKQKAIISILEKEEASADRKELLKFLREQKPPPPSLGLRFEKWATEAALSGWQQDIKAFNQFQRMRNLLVHKGEKRLSTKITVSVDNIQSLEDIATRYVSLALFGDANVNQISKK